MYYKEVEVIWADLDPNLHMRHTAYSDFATHARISFFIDHGFPLSELTEINVGPVLLREQTIYWREVNTHDKLKISVELQRATKDYSKYTISQTFLKENRKKAARVTIDGAWMDLKERKLIPPPSDLVKQVLDKMPRTRDFEYVENRYYIFL